MKYICQLGLILKNNVWIALIVAATKVEIYKEKKKCPAVPDIF